MHCQHLEEPRGQTPERSPKNPERVHTFHTPDWRGRVFFAKVWLGLGSWFGAENTVNCSISAFAEAANIVNNSICALLEPADTVNSGISALSEAADTVNSSIRACPEVANTVTQKPDGHGATKSSIQTGFAFWCQAPQAHFKQLPSLLLRAAPGQNSTRGLQHVKHADMLRSTPWRWQAQACVPLRNSSREHLPYF